MILKLNTRFENYTLKDRIEKNASYREMYRAVDNDGNEVTLIVYDMKALPKCYQDEIIPELELIPLLSQDAFPKYINKGYMEEGSRSLRWIATQYVKGRTLAECIQEGQTFPEKDALEQFYQILLAVNEISNRLNKGSHNNINADNIIIGTDDEGKEKWFLTGLNCMSEPCEGKTTFDTSLRQIAFCAPETVAGIYRQATDIFSLGIVLSLILQERHPWKDALEQDRSCTPSSFAKHIRTVNPKIEVVSPLADIVKKAIAAKPSERFKNIGDFGHAIATYLGEENLGVFEGFNPFSSSASPTTTEDNLKNEKRESEYSRKAAAHKVEVNVHFEQKKGEGFQSVAGMTELKENLSRDFVDIVKHPEIARQFRITPPNGILLYGPPGVGKTYIANRLAEESGLQFTLIKPSDLGNIFMHGSQSMIADLFNKSEELVRKNNCGVLLVFDEFDSLVPKRSANGEDNHQANEVAEFLTRLNNCAEKGIYVVATTNRIESIDPAITRKGRIDQVIYVGLPDEEARKEILELELANRPHEDIDTGYLAKLTKGYTCGDVSYIVKESARCSFDQSIKNRLVTKITQELLEKIISVTRSSVTAEELRKYEKSKDSYIHGNKEERPRIGFVKNR